MEFDYAISNPPYQKDVHSATSSRRVTVDIFPDIQKAMSRVCRDTMMIYPATWQKDLRNGLGRFLLDHGMHYSQYYDGTEVFPSVTEGFPLSIVGCRKGYTSDISINGASRTRDADVWLDSDEKYQYYSSTVGYPKCSPIEFALKWANMRKAPCLPVDADHDDAVKVFIKENPGMGRDVGWFHYRREDVVNDIHDVRMLDSYSVSIRSRVVGRMHLYNELLYKNRSLGAKVFVPGETHGGTWIVVGVFDDEVSARNFASYVNSRLFLVLAGLGITKKDFTSNVPDLGDYTDSSPVNWDNDIDVELGKHFGISS